MANIDGERHCNNADGPGPERKNVGMGCWGVAVSRVSLTLHWGWAHSNHRDGTIVSGDSMGLVKFWDFRTSTQLKSVQAHEADVLCLAISPV